MKKINKFLFTIISCFSILIGVCSPASAREIKSPYNLNSNVDTCWWAGNPNPEPGSEAWLQAHYNFKPGDQATMRRCFVEALGIDYNDLSNYSYIVSAISKKALTVGVVGSIYGGLVALNYFTCCAG